MQKMQMIVIRREKPAKLPSEQTIKEQELLNARIKKNKDRFENVSRFLEKYFDGSVHLKDATDLALSMGKQVGLVVDRRAKRHKPAIICWFCENWEHLYPLLAQKIRSPAVPVQPKKEVEPTFFKRDEILFDMEIQSSPNIDDCFDAEMLDNRDQFWTLF